jgi:hypothetical protein
MDRPFLHLPAAEGSAFINLMQVVRTGEFTDDSVILFMSDGHSVTLHGAEVVTNFMGILADYSLNIIGKPTRLRDEQKSEVTGNEP